MLTKATMLSGITVTRLSLKSIWNIIFSSVVTPMVIISRPIIIVAANVMRTASISLVMYAIISPALCSWKYDTGSVLRWLKRSFRISRSIFLAAPNMQYLHPILPARTNTAITAILMIADAKPDSLMVVYFIPSMTWPTMRGTSVCALSITISIAMPSR